MPQPVGVLLMTIPLQPLIHHLLLAAPRVIMMKHVTKQRLVS